MNLSGKVVLITGAAEGIGAACASEFRRRGAKLSIVDIADNPPTSKEADSLWTTGDITDDAVRRAAVSRTLDRYGRIDIVVNNAGVGLYANPSETQPELAERMFAVNVSAAMGLTNLVVPHMLRQRSGSVVNIESIGALVSLPWCAMYCASKHALHAYTRALRHELKPEGIHVMSVIPGIVDTRFRDHVLGGAAPEGVVSLKRSISPASLAAAIVGGVEKRRSIVVKPNIGWAFWAADLFFPQAMHWYFRRCWTPSRPAGRRSEAVLTFPETGGTSIGIGPGVVRHSSHSAAASSPNGDGFADRLHSGPSGKR